MDFIVHTPGGSIQSVSGVNEKTTCVQIVYALAHAIHQTGSFSLVAVTDDSNLNEYRFSPNEHPHEFVQKCTHRGINVKLELRRLNEAERSYEASRPIGASTNSSMTLNEFETCQHARNISLEQIKNRPPPPDYNAVVAERCKSLRKEAQETKKHPLTFLNISNFSMQDLFTHNFSGPELEALVEMQEKTLTAQKGELVRMELSLLSSNERELVQLRKQHNNLQTVLNSMRYPNWPDIINNESLEAERLQSEIDAMRTALAEKKRELYEAVQLHITLENQMANELNRLEIKQSSR